MGPLWEQTRIGRQPHGCAYSSVRRVVTISGRELPKKESLHLVGDDNKIESAKEKLLELGFTPKVFKRQHRSQQLHAFV